MAEKMSDAEIRSELIALGEKSIGPITDTTRPLYVKKLTRLKSEGKKGRQTSGRGKTQKKPLVGFSSDESDEESVTPAMPSGRKTINKLRSLRSNTSLNISTSSTAASNSITRPSSSNATKRAVKQSNSNTTNNTRRGRPAANTHKPEKSENGNDTYSHLWDDEPLTRSAVMQASFNSTVNKTYDFGEDVHRSVRNQSNEFSDSDHEETEPYKEPWMVSHSVNTSPSLDNSDEWLRKYRSWKPSSDYVSRYQNSGSRDTLLKSRLRRGAFTDQTGVMGTDGYKRSSSPAPSKLSQYTSKLLLILAIMFFIFLAFMYVSMQRAEDILEKESLNLLICDSDTPKKGCYDRETVNKALRLVQEMSSRLMDQAGRYECGYEKDRTLSMRALEDHLKAKFGPDCGKGKKFAYDMLIALELFQKNPSWKVKLYDGTGAVAEDKAAITSMEAEEAKMGFFCRLYRSVERMFRSLVLFTLVTVAVVLLVLFVRFRWRRQGEEQRQIFSMVEKIINILKDHHDACQVNRDLEPYLAIPHVRDQLIPIKERRKHQRVWEQAVKFLSENESRVREETQKIQGEEFLVWRWIQANANGGKVWQGPAFGETQDATSSLPSFRPLPCLKIRNMFDLDSEYERDWHVKIQDAILEKCGPAHGIVHIAVDKKSAEGCVYVKCSNKEAAGRAFYALHGSWFDNRLVTVKFLRLERYHERFPEATECVRQLKPSNDAKASLAQPYHKSFLEQY